MPCNCPSCRQRRDREFLAIIRASYSDREITMILNCQRILDRKVTP